MLFAVTLTSPFKILVGDGLVIVLESEGFFTTVPRAITVFWYFTFSLCAVGTVKLRDGVVGFWSADAIIFFFSFLLTFICLFGTLPSLLPLSPFAESFLLLFFGCSLGKAVGSLLSR
ncbi:hypothetical protein Hanom_Chr05g00440861 [Helianthus anomalus]